MEACTNQIIGLNHLKRYLSANLYILLHSWSLTLGLHATSADNEISNNMVCATSKASDQPAHGRSLIRAFASRLNIILRLSY